MTQEKDLFLKDLCARVPYHPKGHVVNACNGAECDEWLTCATVPMFTSITNNCRLYLRSMLSMTEKEVDTLFKILNIDEEAEGGYEWLKVNDIGIIRLFTSVGKDFYEIAEAMDYLNSIHIDYRGLIPMGLAIEVTKENNPYK